MLKQKNVAHKIYYRGLNILTIDLEDWYHSLDENPINWQSYEDRSVDAIHRILQFLKAADTRATFFVLGQIAEVHPDLIVEICDSGHEIASHGYNHKFIYKQSPREFERDVQRSKSLLESITGQVVLGYRAPYFSITRKSLWALRILRNLGFTYDSSIFPVFNPRYGIPYASRLPCTTTLGLMELPISTYPFLNINIPIGGGIYFRFFPYTVIRKLFKQSNSRGELIIFYLHPWEMDIHQPRLRLPASLKFRHYFGINKTPEKFTQLLNEFRFGSVRELLYL